MRRFLVSTVRFVINEDGPTAVEYAVMLSLIVLVCFAAIFLIGTNTSKNFDKTSKSFW